jgi:hypothetical protein
LYKERWQDVVFFVLEHCQPKGTDDSYSDFETPPHSPWILVEALSCVGVEALKDLNCLHIDGKLQAKIAAKIKEIPKFSTFINRKVV